jgi:hypothetical protein
VSISFDDLVVPPPIAFALLPIGGIVLPFVGLLPDLFLFAGHSVLPGCVAAFLVFPLALAFFLTWFLLAISILTRRLILFPLVGKWCIVAEYRWYIVGEYAWYIVGEYPWHILGEYYWYIIGRLVTPGMSGPAPPSLPAGTAAFTPPGSG